MSKSATRRSRVARVASIALLSAASAVALSPLASPAAAATDAIVSDVGCTTNSMGLNDDSSSGSVPLSSTFNYYGYDFSSVQVSNNGYFQAPGGWIGVYQTDLDTRYTGTPVTYGETTYEGRPALCANWLNIGFYSEGAGSPTVDAQALLVDRSDLQPGDFDVVFNYGRVASPSGWGPYVGFGSSAPYLLPGSGVPGAFDDSNTETGLVHGSRGSTVLGRYVFRFRAGFPVGLTAPDTIIDTQAEALSNDAPSFTYSSSAAAGEHQRYECRVTADGAEPGAFETCPDAGITYDGIADGSYTFEVRAVDTSMNTDSTPASVIFTVDTTGPDTVLTDFPAAGNDSTPSFSYEGTPDDVDGFECRVTPLDEDAGDFATCDDEGITLDELTDGIYLFEVRSLDALGNPDSTPANFMFQVDTTPTSVSIESAPAMLGNDATPSFTYLADPDTDVDHFECVVVPEGAQSADLETCDSEGFTSEELEDGNYSFGVRTVDLVGNVGEPALYDFTVDTLAADTVVSSGPEALDNNTSPAFTYAAAPAGDVDHFECRLVGGAPTEFASCETAGTSYAGLADGDYTFEVRSVDAAGNIDATQATHAFRVDTAAPDTSVTNAPAATIGTDSATFGYDSDSDAATFECRLAAAGAEATWGACPEAGKTFAGLADGGYVFDVRATDAAGNTDATPATHKFLVNVGRPTITAAIESELPISAAGWYRDVVTVTYTCSGNGSALTTPCPAPRQVPRAQQGRVLFTASITTADGDTATVRTPLFIDKGKPSAIIKGFDTSRVYTSVPKARCKAADPRSGVDTCTVKVRKLHTRSGSFIKVKATATDLAGNVRVVTRKARFERS